MPPEGKAPKPLGGSGGALFIAVMSAVVILGTIATLGLAASIHFQISDPSGANVTT